MNLKIETPTINTAVFFNSAMRLEDADGKTTVWTVTQEQPGPEGIKHFPCSTQLSMEFFLLINVKMPTIVGI